MPFQSPATGYTAMPGRSNAFCCIGVGRVTTMSGCSRVISVMMVLRASIARSEVTAMGVTEWLKSLGLEQYAAAFCVNDVDAELLPTLTVDELKDIGVSSIRHRRRLLEAIAALRSQATPAEPVT